MAALNLFLAATEGQTVSFSINFNGGLLVRLFIVGLIAMIFYGVFCFIGWSIRFWLTCVVVGALVVVFGPLIASIFEFLASLLCFNMSAVDLGLLITRIPQSFMLC